MFSGIWQPKNPRLILAAACLAMSGCTVLPGHHISTGGLHRDHEDKLYRVVVLTPDSLRKEVAAPAVDEIAEGGKPGDLYEYRIGPGDVLTVVVWDHPELTNPTGSAEIGSVGQLVGADGSLFYPNVGSVPAAGKTSAQLRVLLTEKLSRVLREPQVDVKVTGFRSQRVYVTGEVLAPGAVAIDDTPKTILDALIEKGGVAATANRLKLYLMRDGETREIDMQALLSGNGAKANLRLRNGDVIHVPDNSREKVFVLGATTTQTVVPFQRSYMTLAEAITSAGGLANTTANDRAVFVFRPELSVMPTSAVAGTAVPAPQMSVYALDLSRPEGLLIASGFEMKSRDIVYVAQTDFAKYNGVIGQLLPTISAVFQVDRLTNTR